MRVFVTIEGALRRYFLRETMELQLPEQAVLRDFLLFLDKEIVPDIGQPYWNHEKKKFRGPVIIRADGNILWDETTPLKDGQHLSIKRFLIGG